MAQRIIKRGQEDINYDTFVNQAVSELNYQLANQKLSDKEQAAIRKDFATIVDGLINGTFTYNISGGFDNTAKMRNVEKGFDSAGLAAGILGNTLRSQTAYVPEPDPNKIKWTGTESIGQALNKYLSANGKLNVKDFVGLDYDTKSKTVKGNANRSKRFKEALTYVKDNFDSLFTEFQDSDKTSALKNIDLALAAFKDDNFTQNEYFDVGRATGLSGFSDLFGDVYEAPTKIETPAGASAETPSETPASPSVSEEQWMATNHPITPSKATLNRSLKYTTIYPLVERQKLVTVLSRMNKGNLFKVIAIGLGKDKSTYELNSLIKEPMGGLYNFENNAILSAALRIAKRNNWLQQFPNDLNSYYIPFGQLEPYKSKNTGLVFKVGLSNTEGDKVIEMDKHNIPYFQKLWHQEYINSHKQGGVLKFQEGGTANWYDSLINDFDASKYTYNYNTNQLVNADFEKLNQGIFDPWISNQSSDAVGRYLPTDGYGEMGINKAHYNYALGIEQNNPYYKQFGEALLDAEGKPTEVGLAWMHAVDDQLPVDSPARFFDAEENLKQSWTPSGNDSHGRAQKSYNKLSDYINAIRNDQILGARHNIFLNEGKRYFYKDKNGVQHWVNPEEVDKYIVSENPITQGWNNDKTVYWKDYELTGLKEPQEEEHSELWKKIFRDGLYEKYFPNPKEKFNWQTSLHKYFPDLMDLGRLINDITFNKRNADKIRPSLSPVIQDPINIHKRLLGNFPIWQQANQQGAETMMFADRQKDADADRNRATMFEAQRANTNLRIKGALADNDAIKRSLEDQFNVDKEQLYWNKQNIYMPNKIAINKANREVAQLDAAARKATNTSISNYLAGNIKRLRDKQATNESRVNTFYDDLVAQRAEQWYNNVVNPATRAFSTWLADPKNRDKDPTEWPEYETYSRFKQNAKFIANNMINVDFARRYDIPFDNPYPRLNTDLYTWNRRNMPDVRLS